MAYVDPGSFPSLSILTSGQMGVVGDDLRWFYAPNARCSVNMAVPPVSTANNTETIITWDNSDLNPGAMWSATSSQSHVTVPVDGTYLISVHCEWSANATGSRESFVYKNNVPSVAIGGLSGPASTNASRNTRQTYSFEAALANGDFFELRVYQNSTGTLNVTPSMRCSWQSSRF